jgi:hypothetical protein
VKYEEFRDQFDLKEEPTIANRFRFIIRDPRYSPIDKIEYFAYILFGFVVIALTLLFVAFYLLPTVGVLSSLSLGSFLLFVVYVIIAAWKKSRKIYERFVYPYRIWVGGEEYAHWASSAFWRRIHESKSRSEPLVNSLFFGISWIHIGIFLFFYVVVIILSFASHLPVENTTIVAIVSVIFLLLGLIYLNKAVQQHFEAIRQNSLLLVIIVVFITLVAVLVLLFF